MTSILEKVARNAFRVQFGRFRPKTAHEFFALRLAAKLGDNGAVQHYLKLAGKHSEGQLLLAYRRALESGEALDLARRFHVELAALHRRDAGHITRGRLAALRIERRAVAVAIVTGDHLEYAQARQLSSVAESAVSTAVGFFGRMIAKFSIRSIVLEAVPRDAEIRRVQLYEATVRSLKDELTGIVEVSRSELFEAFGYPPVQSRPELRYIASRIWPVLDEESGGPWTHDAAALGLYVQTERLFNIIN